MKRIAIEKKILFGFIMAFAASLLLGFALYRSANEVLLTQQWVGHSKDVIGHLDDLTETMVDLNAAWNSYTRSRDVNALSRLSDLERQISVALENLRRLNSNNAEQQERIVHVQSVSVGALKAITDAVNSPLPANGEAQVAPAGIQAHLDEARKVLRETREAEQTLFEKHFAEDRGKIRNTTSMILLTILIQFCILVFLYWLAQTDVAERKRAEAAMRKSSEDLAVAHDAAVSATKVKSQFLANMSHEIRTPMNGVMGMTEILLDTTLTTRQREFAETIQSSANALLTIINDILDFSKIEAGMLRYERVPFNLHTTIESIIDLFVQSARKKGLELAVLIEESVPASVKGDPFRLRQVLTNLLGNAIKFTNEGEVVLRCSEVSDVDGYVTVHFEVSDTGIGVSVENQDSLFRPFVQADGSTTRHFGGTGLGLAISNQLVTGMGGEMGLESTPGVGSKFWFTIRFETAEPFAPGRQAVVDLRNVRVLLVDDNSTNRKILHYQVTAWGMRDSVASSGPAAITLLRKGAARRDPYAVAILDAHMPELSGLQVVELIRADPSVAGVKVVLLTSAEPESLEANFRSQVDAYIPKPVKQSQLFETLCQVIGIDSGTPTAKPVEPEPLFTTSQEKKLRVLLAEDNLVNQRVALYQLRMLEHHADLAQNGVEALKLFDQHQYDVILMDIHMPEMDGYSATAAIRKREGNKRHTWIIATTANALPEDREKCLAAGMDDYLAKPIQAKALVYALEKCVSQLETKPPASDLRALVEAGMGDMVPELITVFLETAPQDIEKMRRASKDDGERLANAAHNLKGSCANLGATHLSGLCQEIEKRGRIGNLEEVPGLLEEAEAEFERVKGELLATQEEVVP